MATKLLANQIATLLPQPGWRGMDVLVRCTAMGMLVAYLLFSYGLQLTLATEAALIFFLAFSANIYRVTYRPIAQLPSWGILAFCLLIVVAWGRLILVDIFSAPDGATLALRDAYTYITMVVAIASGYALSRPTTLSKLIRFTPLLIGAGIFYAIGVKAIGSAVYSFPIKVSGVPVVGSSATCWMFIIVGVAYILISGARLSMTRIAVAFLLVGYAIAVIQTRTNYLALGALTVFLFFFYPRRVTLFALAFVPLAVVAVGILELGVLVLPEGRLGHTISFAFLIDHFWSMFGMADGPASSASEGFHQRLEWWGEILNRFRQEPALMLFGLGFGDALTDHYSSGGASVRALHNSYIEALARIGVIGALLLYIFWLALVRSWFTLWRKSALARKEMPEVGTFLLVLACYFICVWVLAIGEDGFEKPYNIVPFYFLWGVVLRMLRNIRQSPQNGGNELVLVNSQRAARKRRPSFLSTFLC